MKKNNGMLILQNIYIEYMSGYCMSKVSPHRSGDFACNSTINSVKTTFRNVIFFSKYVFLLVSMVPLYLPNSRCHSEGLRGASIPCTSLRYCS